MKMYDLENKDKWELSFTQALHLAVSKLGHTYFTQTIRIKLRSSCLQTSWVLLELSFGFFQVLFLSYWNPSLSFLFSGKCNENIFRWVTSLYKLFLIKTYILTFCLGACQNKGVSWIVRGWRGYIHRTHRISFL